MTPRPPRVMVVGMQNMVPSETRRASAQEAGFQSLRSRIQGLRRRLSAPVDGASVAAFRMAFGLAIAWEMARYLDPSRDWVRSYYQEPSFRFAYWPMDFVGPLPGPWLPFAFGLIALAALGLASGLAYRFSAGLTALGLCYIFLLDQARYLNHFYLLCLLAILLMLVPADRCYSLGAGSGPGGRPENLPLWSLWILRFQVGIPYFFGGVAKLNGDWLRGQPMMDWLSYRTDFPLIGAWFSQPWLGLSMSWAGLALDLLAVPLLLWRRSRGLAFLCLFAFHLFNARLFSIGIFPWVMIAATSIFFEPDWPRRLLGFFAADPAQRRPRRRILMGFVLGYLLGAWLPVSFDLAQALFGGLGGALSVFALLPVPGPDPASAAHRGAGRPPGSERWPDAVLDEASLGRLHWEEREAPRISSRLLGLILLWLALQILLPLRHLFIPGDVHWTEEGHRFAWHMKLRDKSASAAFVVMDPATGQSWHVDNREYLSERQISKMAARPDMIVQFARYLARRFAEAGFPDVQIYADVHASLNDHPRQRLVDPAVDLSRVAYPWYGHAPWILAMDRDR